MQHAMIALQIVEIFARYRMTPTEHDEFEQKGKQLFINKLEDFIRKNEVIEFIMLGFPFKSTNDRDKVRYLTWENKSL